MHAAQLEQRHRTLVRALSCFNQAIILCDLSSPGDWRVVYANDAWGTLTGGWGGTLCVYDSYGAMV